MHSARAGSFTLCCVVVPRECAQHRVVSGCNTQRECGGTHLGWMPPRRVHHSVRVFTARRFALQECYERQGHPRAGPLGNDGLCGTGNDSGMGIDGVTGVGGKLGFMVDIQAADDGGAGPGGKDRAKGTGVI